MFYLEELKNKYSKYLYSQEKNFKKFFIKGAYFS